MFYDALELFLFLVMFLSLTPILGTYMAKVFTGSPTFLSPFLGRLEHLAYKASGVDPEEEMTWVQYGKALLLFNIFGFLTLLFFLRFQGFLPLNPENLGAVPWALAFNIAVSFTTNTNWQSYAGESTLSYLTQMMGITSQNFLSAATGMGALLVLTRGFIRKTSSTIGNFWADLVRMVVYLLLPLSIIMALVLVGEGVVQTFSPYVKATTLENTVQTIPLGPAASQIAIKQLGTNGGGFFNANSAHPFENPTSFSNFLEMLAILLIPAASVYSYGVMIGSTKHAWILLATMCTLAFVGGIVAFTSENIHNPVLNAYPLVEGTESRLGITDSVVWTVLTTATANGSVNAMLSSLSPLAGGVALFNIMLGELVFGGIGVGLCSMLMLTLLTVFLSGLMVGRTPEYLGKKIEKREMQWIMMAVLLPGALVLAGSGIAVVLPEALSSLSNKGPHGLSAMLYAFASAAGNNGSAFAGLNSNTTFFNLTLGLVMLLGRIAIMLPSLALGGLLAKKKIIPPSVGTFSTNTVLFFILQISVILIVGGLTFFPALSLGPLVEFLLMLRGRAF